MGWIVNFMFFAPCVVIHNIKHGYAHFLNVLIFNVYVFYMCLTQWFIFKKTVVYTVMLRYGMVRYGTIRYGTVGYGRLG
jgi:hypothetical protein